MPPEGNVNLRHSGRVGFACETVNFGLGLSGLKAGRRAGPLGATPRTYASKPETQLLRALVQRARGNHTGVGAPLAFGSSEPRSSTATG
jgi:hypothetical protein